MRGPFECELVLRENDHETRQTRSFVEAVTVGTYVHLDRRDWIVIEVQERAGGAPEVICRPVEERY
jgi:hypothetical protein